MIFYIFIFIICCFILYFSSQWVIKSTVKIARFLNWKEFVVAFFTIAFAASLPNLFVGISSAFHKIPQLSFGDIVGGNIVDLTLAIGLAVLFSKGGIVAESKTIQTSAIYTLIAAILPLILILDNNLSRIDGILLISLFIFYFLWLFSKKERFTKTYDGSDDNSTLEKTIKNFRSFLIDLLKTTLGLILLLIASNWIVRSAQTFAHFLKVPLDFIGILIVGLGNALPETYFSILSARKNEGWLILGNLMGTVVVAATLVLGIVVLLHPIEIADFSPFAIARTFLVISALFFIFFIKSDQKISKKEAFFLLFLYFAFIFTEIIVRIY